MNEENDSLLPTAAKIFVPAQILFACYLMLRGHNLPGGGFIGGLVLASAIVLKVMVNPQRRMKWEPLSLAGAGLLIALGSALLPLLWQKPFFTGLWWGSIWLPMVGKIKLGTPLTFDIGVYLVVTGVGAKMLLVLLALIEEHRAPKIKNLDHF
ncbi:MAG: MnhB domain-containing protein [Akkermansiaceae bacterium]